MKNLSKTYKFIYILDSTRYESLDKKLPCNYMFGNRMEASYYSYKWDVHNFFRRHDDYTTRKHLTDKKIRRTHHQDFLKGPATEAAITLAFVKYFTYELNRARRTLTYLNKNKQDTSEIYNVYNPEYYRVMIKHHKHNLAIWKAKYQTLKDKGVYTYLELVK